MKKLLLLPVLIFTLLFTNNTINASNAQYTLVEIPEYYILRYQDELSTGDGEVVGVTLKVPYLLSELEIQEVINEYVRSFQNYYIENSNDLNDMLFPNELYSRILHSYQARNRRIINSNFRGRLIHEQMGARGIVLSIALSHTLSHNVTAGLNVQMSSVTALVGFNVTSSVTFTDTASWTVPNAYTNGGILRVFARESQTGFDIYRVPLIGNATRAGSGFVNRLLGTVEFVRVRR